MIIYKVPTDFFQIFNKIFFCTETSIFVLKFIFLYWDTHCCSVVIFFFHFFFFNFLYRNFYFCSDIYIFVLG